MSAIRLPTVWLYDENKKPLSRMRGSGFGAMPDYAAQIRPADRWAIAAYIRALQLSAHATLDDVPVAERGRLENGR